MRMAVGAFARGQVHGPDVHVVVAIGRVPRRRPGEQGVEVREQQRLVFVDDDGRRGVQALDVDEPAWMPASAASASIRCRQVDELHRALGRDADPGVVADCRGHECLHGPSSCRAPADSTGGVRKYRPNSRVGVVTRR